MKRKIAYSILFLFLLLLISIVYFKVNYKTLDEAIRESNIDMDEIFFTTTYKGQTIILYGQEDILSAGLIEKTPLGYRWGLGAGSKHFNQEERMLTRSFSNLHPKNKISDEELVSLTYGVIYDDSIEKIWIKYKDQDLTKATILVTSKGLIWYCFSETPVHYDPEVIIIFKDGTSKTGWY